MSDQSTPTPPWRREYAKLPYLEKAIWSLYFDDRHIDAQAAWDELIELRTRLAALERVVNAAEAVSVMRGSSTHNEFDVLQAAIDAAKEKEIKC